MHPCYTQKLQHQRKMKNIVLSHLQYEFALLLLLAISILSDPSQMSSDAMPKMRQQWKTMPKYVGIA